MKEFIALHNRTVSRDEIQTVIALAKEQNNTEVIYRLSKILNDHPDSNRFNINIINYPQETDNQAGLAGTRHSGDYREALDECGRLKKGWHFVDGKVVKTTPKAQSTPKASKATTISKNTQKNNDTNKKYKFIVFIGGFDRIAGIYSYQDIAVNGFYYEKTFDNGIRLYKTIRNFAKSEETKTLIEEQYTEGKDFVYLKFDGKNKEKYYSMLESHSSPSDSSSNKTTLYETFAKQLLQIKNSNNDIPSNELEEFLYSFGQQYYKGKETPYKFWYSKEIKPIGTLSAYKNHPLFNKVKNTAPHHAGYITTKRGEEILDTLIEAIEAIKKQYGYDNYDFSKFWNIATEKPNDEIAFLSAAGIDYFPEAPDDETQGLGKPVPAADIYKMVTDKIIGMLKSASPTDYHRPWKDDAFFIPLNYDSKKPYRGVNRLLLQERIGFAGAFRNPYFLTFKQIKKHKGTLKKGAKGYEVIYYSIRYVVPADKNTGRKAYSSTNTQKVIDYLAKNKLSEDIVTRIPMIRYYNVYNGASIEGIDFQLDKLQIGRAVPDTASENQAAALIVENYPNPPAIKHEGNRAYYSPSGDYVKMPKKEQFDSINDYYRILFHELTHSTGHDKRLDRGIHLMLEKEDYAKEELVAEFGAVFLSAWAGIMWYTNKNHAVYLKNWNSAIKEAENDNKFLMRAASLAQQATDYILALDKDGNPAFLKKLQPKKAPKKENKKENKKEETSTKTPFLEEYRQLKAKYPEHLIIVSMEDHQNYCMYGKDAVIAADILKLQLLKLKRNDEFSISVGFKYKNLREYLEKLVKAGYKVALVGKDLDKPQNSPKKKTTKTPSEKSDSSSNKNTKKIQIIPPYPIYIESDEENDDYMQLEKELSDLMGDKFEVWANNLIEQKRKTRLSERSKEIKINIATLKNKEIGTTASEYVREEYGYNYTVHKKGTKKYEVNLTIYRYGHFYPNEDYYSTFKTPEECSAFIIKTLDEKDGFYYRNWYGLSELQNKINELKGYQYSKQFHYEEEQEETALFGKYPETDTDRFKKMKVSELRTFTMKYYNLYLKGDSATIEKYVKEVVFINTAGRKIAYGEAMYSAKAAVIAHLKTLIKNSTYNNWGERKASDGKDVLGYLNFKSKITIDNKKRHVRISLVVYKDRRTELKNVEVGKNKKVSHFAQDPIGTLQDGRNETLSTESVAKTVPNSALSAPKVFVEHSPDPATQSAPSITPRNNSIANKMATLQNRTFETFIIAEPQMQAFLGDVERKNTGSTAITITGGAGSGKTRFAFQFINALAQNYKVGHASLEEQPDSKLYFDKVQQYLDQTAQANVEAPEIENMQDLQALIERNDVIVIDSFTKIREWDRNFLLDRDLRKKYNGKLFLIIFQQTVAGNMRGGTTSEFDGDIILYTQVFPDYRENYIYPSKNRYNSTPSEQLRYSVYHQQLLPSESTPPDSSPVTSNTYEVIY